jgi:uncharacterized coiled-coil protein SlyX
MSDFDQRIGALEDELKHRDKRIAELKAELDEARALIADMEEHVQECREITESWIEAFEMRRNDDGKMLVWASFVEQHDDLVERHNALVREWNKMVTTYNVVVAPKNIGRPLEASEAQCIEVQRLRKTGASLRTIVTQTGLGLRTIRTIIGRQNSTDRTSKRTNALRKRELNRQRMLSWRARKRTRDALPRRITASLARGDALPKAAKGIDRR